MTMLTRILDQPRTLTARRVLFQIHLWTGIAIGLYAFMIGISGSALVFHDELQVAADPRLYRMEDASGSPRLTPDEAVAAAKRAWPDARLTGLFLPLRNTETYRVSLLRSGKPVTAAVHSKTGAVIEGRTGGFLPWLRQLHFNLLAGRTGRVVNGAGGLLMALLCLTGVAIWWQGRGNWKRGLRVEWSAGWKRVNWDLHSLTGFVSAAFLFVLSITGAYFAWPQTYRNIVGWFAPVTKPGPRAAPQSTAAGGTASLSMIVEAAERAVPGRKASRLMFGDKPGDTVRVMLFEGAVGHALPANTVVVDSTSARVLSADLYANRAAGDLMVSWIAPLHFGNFGGIGVKVLWAILGLAPSFLFVTGFLMWWNRVVRRRRRQAEMPEPVLAGQR